MNKLLKLGLRSQSLKIIEKYLPSHGSDTSVAKEIFEYSVRHKKVKILEFLFEKNELSQVPWFEKAMLEQLKGVASISSNLSRKIAEYELIHLKVKEETSPTSNEQEDFSHWDWEPESFDLPNKKDDKQLIESAKQEHAILSKTGLEDDSLDILTKINFALPSSSRKGVEYSRFIQKHKQDLKEIFRKIQVIDVVHEDAIREIVESQFDNEIHSDLLQATQITLGLASFLAPVDLNTTVNRDFTVSSFDDWLNQLDALLIDSKQPILKDYLLNEYYKDIGRAECEPLNSKAENELLNKIQNVCYELVFEHKKAFITYSMQSKSEVLEFELFSFTDDVVIDGLSDNELGTILEVEIDLRQLFLKPLSIFEYFSSYRNTITKHKVMKLQKLAYQFQVCNLRLVLSQAKKYFRWAPTYFFDLIQIGNLSLLSAIDKFDPKRGNKFSTYAMWWIKQSMHRFIADNQAVVRVPVHYYEKIYRKFFFWCEKTGIDPKKYDFKASEINEISRQIECTPDELESLFERAVIHLDLKESYEPLIELVSLLHDEDKQLITYILGRGVLTEKEHKIIDLRFGLTSREGLTLEEVGMQFSVTRERIRQIEAKALRKLKRHVRALDEYRDQFIDEAEEEADES